MILYSGGSGTVGKLLDQSEETLLVLEQKYTFWNCHRISDYFGKVGELLEQSANIQVVLEQ
jgi:hypothetical protein